jgi:hypothetical protein
VLTLTLEGQEIVLGFLVILSSALLAQVEASTADEASLSIVKRDLAELDSTHDRIRANNLPIFFHYLNIYYDYDN